MGTNNLRGKVLVYGVGMNDVDIPTRHCGENGARVGNNRYYNVWFSMMERCYSEKYQSSRPSYRGCSVHQDWHKFSNFMNWLDTQPQADWQTKQMDKDLLVKGNKEYGPNTCCFLSNHENNIFKLSISPLGSVSYASGNRKKPWRARVECKGKHIDLGYYTSEEEASVVSANAGIQRAVNLALLNPHRFIQNAMFSWIADWKQEITLMESEFQKIKEANNGTATLQDHLC